MVSHLYTVGFPDGSDGKESACNVRDLGSIPGLGRSPGAGTGYPLQDSCLENPHGQRSLAGYIPWSLKKSDTTELLIHTPVPNILGLLWWISPLRGPYWLALRTFILEERNHCLFRRLLTLLGGFPSLSQSLILL